MGLQIERTAFDVAMFSSTKVDIASDRFQTAYGADAHVERLRREPGFSMQSTRVSFGRTVISKLNMSNLKIFRPTGVHVIVTVSLRGSALMQTGRNQRELSATGSAVVTRAGELLEMSIPKGFGFALYAPVDRLQERVERITGRTQPISLHMSDTIDLKAPAGAALARTMQTAFAEMTALSSADLATIVAASYEDLLLDLAAASLFPAIASEREESQANCGSQTLRLAREFIREHSAEVVELSKLAADLGVSMRSLQENFRRYCGFSPRDYLMECRLDDARQRLQTGSDHLSVTDVALQSGFSDLSHFAAKYRDKFGELPSETLNVARRA